MAATGDKKSWEAIAQVKFSRMMSSLSFQGSEPLEPGVCFSSPRAYTFYLLGNARTSICQDSGAMAVIR